MSAARLTTPATIQRTYLVLLLGNTLAASLIWGINTIFLLDAGLSNFDAALCAAVANPRAVLAVGGRLRAHRFGLHVLLRRRRGVVGGRAQGDRLHRRAGSGLRARTGCHRRGDARRLGPRRVDRPADQPGRALRAAWPHPRCHVRGGVSAHARCRVLPREGWQRRDGGTEDRLGVDRVRLADRKSTRLNSSHRTISYAVFCLKKKKQ